MLFKRLIFSLVAPLAIVALIQASASGQDSLSVSTDSTTQKKETTARTFKTAFYVSGVYSTSTNDAFFQKQYKTGIGAQVGVALYTHRYYTLRFNLGYTQHKFQKDEYLKSDTLHAGDEVQGNNMATVTLLPDVMIHPFPEGVFSPYLSLGVGTVIGANDTYVNFNAKSGATSKMVYDFGNRFVAQVGVGGTLRLSPWLGVVLGASYSFEFLKSNQQEDIFFKFEQVDRSYKFIHYHLGLQIKLPSKK